MNCLVDLVDVLRGFTCNICSANYLVEIRKIYNFNKAKHSVKEYSLRKFNNLLPKIRY